MPTDWDPWPGNTNATWFDMGAEYSDASERLAAGIQDERKDETADGPIEMRIDDGVCSAGEWQRTSKLFVRQLADDEDGEDPAIQVAPPQVCDRAGHHDAVQRSGSADAPVELRIGEPEPQADRDARPAIHSRPAPGRIVTREQRPHEHHAQAVEHGVLHVQVHEVRRQKPPPLTRANCLAIETQELARRFADEFGNCQERADTK